MTRNQPCPQHRMRCDQAGGCVAQQVSRCRLGRLSPRCQPLQRQQRRRRCAPCTPRPNRRSGPPLAVSAPKPVNARGRKPSAACPAPWADAAHRAPPSPARAGAPGARLGRTTDGRPRSPASQEQAPPAGGADAAQDEGTPCSAEDDANQRAQGVEGLGSLKIYFQKVRGSLPVHAAAALQTLIRVTDCLVDAIERLESRILDWHRANDASR